MCVYMSTKFRRVCEMYFVDCWHGGEEPAVGVVGERQSQACQRSVRRHTDAAVWGHCSRCWSSSTARRNLLWLEDTGQQDDSDTEQYRQLWLAVPLSSWAGVILCALQALERWLSWWNICRKSVTDKPEKWLQNLRRTESLRKRFVFVFWHGCILPWFIVV